MAAIRFRFSPIKARAAVHWMLQRAPGSDLHTILKACYFADKAHLNAYDRPIFGAEYRAMRFGPVPIEIYEMAKGESYWLAELGANSYPWRLFGYAFQLTTNEQPDLSVLSETDMAELESGLERSRTLTFSERTAATHGADWQAAKLGIMRYEDMLEESPKKQERISYLRQMAPHIKL